MQLNNSGSAGTAFAIVTNVLVIAVAIYAWALLTIDPDLYYLSIQEDEYLEWSTFWAFFVAAIVFLRQALKPAFDLRTGWFVIGLALFCLLVAMEEISWGQRIIGYQPPEYFLEFNFQQELNFHNIVSTDLRKLTTQVVILGYGVVLPIIMFVPVIGRLLQRIGIVPPPVELIPAFLVTSIGQVWYPVKFTGEWIELMLGLCFLFSALGIHRPNTQNRPPRKSSTAGRAAIAWLAVMALGVAGGTLTRSQRNDEPGNIQAAQTELEALRRDILGGTHQRCNVHKRLYAYDRRYGRGRLATGEFSRLVQRGLPEQRAEYLLDPWNYAYWIRDNCAQNEHERTIYLYSFGPNRRRDSTKWEIGGDDIAVIIRGKR